MPVDAAEREVPEHDLEGGTALEQATDLAHGRGGVRALEVAVHDHLPPYAHTSSVVIGVDRCDQVERHFWLRRALTRCRTAGIRF